MMIRDIAAFFWRIAGWRTFLLSLAIYLVFGAYVMPHGAGRIQQMSHKNVKILDLQFGYSPEKARNILSEYTEESRIYAAQFSLLADSVYPWAYGFLFIIITAWIFKSLAQYGIVYRYVHLLPIFIMAVDYCENAGIISMLKDYPHISDKLINMASTFTTLKWSLVIANAISILSGLAALIYMRFSKAKSNS